MPLICINQNKKGWLYLTTVIDLGDRKIIGWALTMTMKAIDTVIPAFKMAQARRPITGELIFHSDCGFSTLEMSSDVY